VIPVDADAVAVVSEMVAGRGLFVFLVVVVVDVVAGLAAGEKW
jgi:hypothetical protein